MDESYINIILVGILISLLITGMELIVRSKGTQPRTPQRREDHTIIPEGKLYKAHPRLGFVFQPGSFSITINDRFEFTANHDENGHRITSDKRENETNSERPEIWFFGCSFTYGWLVNDDETFPWLIQERLEDWKIVNFGVSGYSSLQSYLQFKETLSEKKSPRILMLIYGGEIHNKRNTLTRHWKKNITRAGRESHFLLPCGRINKQGDFKITFEQAKYIGFPFSTHSALIHRLERRYDIQHDKRLNNEEVAQRILLKFQQLCDEVNSIFIVAGIHTGKKTKKMLEFCNKHGMKTLDISVDRGAKHPEHSFYPYDDHPSPIAHKKYADAILKNLWQEKLLLT